MVKKAPSVKVYPPMTLPIDLAHRIDKVRKKLLSERPGETLSRANVIRMLLASGCEQFEAKQ